MDESEFESIWMTDILPIIGECMIPASYPVTVFLGGQPAAGKTRAQRRLTDIYDGLLTPIIGDDFRRYHPNYERLLSETPLDMPDVTARAAGYWTGKAVAHADEKRASCIIEGTWRNAATVLDEAEKARSLNRGTHAVVLAVPPALSRLGLLYRFYRDLDAGGQARWTPPKAHEDTVAALPLNVRTIAASGLFDRLSVMDRSGAFLYDGDDPNRFENAWNDRFLGRLNGDEMEQAERDLDYVESIRRETGVGLEESEPVIERIYTDLGVRDFPAELEELDDMPRRTQPREPKGTPHGGRWRR